MNDPAITPATAARDPDVHWLLRQHEHDLEALEVAAGVIAAQGARIHRLEADQAALILDSRRREAR